ncbi:hypothetical protein [Haloferula sargassicola]
MKKAIIILASLAGPDLVACPTCNTETGIAVRAGIFNDAFLQTLGEVLAPFPVLALGLFLVNRLLPD